MPPRDPAELYKDKIEVSLDGRQIFYLFFGGAVIVGLVFVLGVMVGRRVEARGHLDPARTTAATDPLAALDRLESSGSLSFQGALTGNQATSDVERAIGDLEKARKAEGKGDAKAERVEARGGDKASDKSLSEKSSSDKSSADKSEKSADKSSSDKSEKSADKSSSDKSSSDKSSDKSEKSDKSSDKSEKSADKSASDKSSSDKSSSDKSSSDKSSSDKSEKSADKSSSDKSSDKSGKSDKSDKTADKSSSDKSSDKSDKSRYTLQLSSFQDKKEAEAFLSSLKSSGYQARITEAEVSGKGTFFRVRLGTYNSLEAANDAKSDFEKSSKKSASVMKL